MKQKHLFQTSVSATLVALASCGGVTVRPIGDGPTAGTDSGGSAGAIAGSPAIAGGPAIAGASDTDGPSVQGGGSAQGGFGNPAGEPGLAAAGSSGIHVVDRTLAARVKGTWSGYVENFAFDDGSDAITLVLDAAGSGQVRFGAAPTFPPANDPNIGYPPSYQQSPPAAGSAGSPGGGLPVTSPDAGFQFTMRNVSLEKARLQFDVAPMQLWAAWCELQTSFEESPAYYSCLQRWEGGSDSTGCFLINPNNRRKTAVDCSKLHLCLFDSVCACNASGCAEHSGVLLHFDLALADSKADGSVARLGSFASDPTLHNVHLTQQ